MPKFSTKTCVDLYDRSGGASSKIKQIRFVTSMLRSDLYDYGDAYLITKGTPAADGGTSIDKYNKKLIFENKAPFNSCI